MIIYQSVYIGIPLVFDYKSNSKTILYKCNLSRGKKNLVARNFNLDDKLHLASFEKWLEQSYPTINAQDWKAAVARFKESIVTTLSPSMKMLGCFCGNQSGRKRIKDPCVTCSIPQHHKAKKRKTNDGTQKKKSNTLLLLERRGKNINYYDYFELT